ncbi:Replication factor C small subunit, partial [Candidatus Woesearchaeota archaeon]|nr:Replication factor C small subunit [Candidatus Woesearchaeota archaeon]
KGALFDVSGGDVRRAINTLHSSSAVNKTVSADTIYEISNFAKPRDVDTVLMMSLDGEFEKAKNKLLDIMLNNGLGGLDMIKQIQSEVSKLDIDGKVKMKMIEKCGEIEFRMVEGSDEFVQLEALLASFGIIQ